MAKLGSKAARTGKCKCDNPDISIWELRITNTGELVITLDCKNCHALWDSKSRAARRYCNTELRYHSGKSTYQEIFNKADNLRKQHLQGRIQLEKNKILEAEKEIRKAEKELAELKEAAE